MAASASGHTRRCGSVGAARDGPATYRRAGPPATLAGPVRPRPRVVRRPCRQFRSFGERAPSGAVYFCAFRTLSTLRAASSITAATSLEWDRYTEWLAPLISVVRLLARA